MKDYIITKSRRLRSTPFTSRIEKHGLKNYTVYNHMLLPTVFSNLEDEYLHLKKHVQIWDVSVQREIEISGKDSTKLVQLMTCRNLSKSKIGKCYYAPLIDSDAGLINDPLIYRLNENTWRVCIADSDVILFAKGIAAGRNLEVKIFEAKIDTLAIQGPKSEKIMEKVFGPEITNLKFFNFNFYKFEDQSFLISKSGYSKQGGYEIHVENIDAGLRLYDHFFEIGKEFDLKPGAPNLIERIEGGLLSYGNDMDNGDNPFECGFDKYVDLESDIVFLGKEKLKYIKEKGIKKKLMGVKIDMKSISIVKEIPLYSNENIEIGELRSAGYSPKYNKVVGIGMINKNYWNISQNFKVKFDNKEFIGEVCSLPFN